VQANEIFGAYREQYYEGGISSVYLWEPQPEEGDDASASAPAAPGAFAGCFLVHKGEGSGRHGGGLERGYWDAIHVGEARTHAHTHAHAHAYTCTHATLSLSFLRVPHSTRDVLRLSPLPPPCCRLCPAPATRRRSTS
jgi:hypothetical protein